MRRISSALSGFAALLSAACGGEDASSGYGRDDAPVRVVAREVALVAEKKRVEAVGTARARAAAELYPENAGEVTAVHVSAGDTVEAGRDLIDLDAREEEIAARLAEVAVSEAEQLLARYRRIENTGAVSASQIDEARTALEAARLRVEQARLALSERTVRAPFEGHLSIVDVDPGQRVTTNTILVRIDDRRTLFIDFDAPETVFGAIKPGDPIEAIPFAQSAAARSAVVAAVDSRIDPARRSFRVRTEIDNSDDALRPGMSFRIGFELLGEKRPAVPETAIAWGSDGPYLWRVEDGKARRTSVEIVERRDGTVLVRANLARGDLVVSEGVHKMREGALVENIGPDTASFTPDVAILTGTE